jgi:heptosyltransferase-2
MPQNILVRMPNWIGDLVMATPVLTDLRTAFPDASITAMCCTPTCELLQTDPTIDELFCFTKPLNKFLRRQERRNIIAKLEKSKFDIALLLTNSFSSAWWCWQANIPRRIGYAAHFRTFLLTDAMKKPQKMHQVDQYKHLLSALSIPTPSTTKPRLFVDTQEEKKTKLLLYQRGFIEKKKLIGINPAAAYGTAKCWPPKRFRELALALAKEYFVILLGDASTFSLVRNICKGLPSHVLNLAGVTSLRELACLIKACDLFITNDSGPMHIAAAFGTPLIALFGSTDDSMTGPYGQKEAVINKHIPCSPCFKRTCPIHHLRCMTEISVEEVLQKAYDQLGTSV